MARRPSPAQRRRDLADLSREEILAMRPSELERALRRAGVDLDVAAMREAADSVYATMAIAMENGVEALDDATWAGLDRRAENAMRDQVRRQVKGVARDVRMEKLSRALARQGRKRAPRLIWIATMVGTCASCVERHGRELPLEQWRRMGLPGSAALICDGNCNCQLLVSGDEAPATVELEAML